MFANLKEIIDNKLEDLIFDNQQLTYTCDDFCITPLPDKSLLEVGISRAKYSAPIGHYVDNKDFCTHLARILPSTLTLAGVPENTKLGLLSLGEDLDNINIRLEIETNSDYTLKERLGEGGDLYTILFTLENLNPAEVMKTFDPTVPPEVFDDRPTIEFTDALLSLRNETQGTPSFEHKAHALRFIEKFRSTVEESSNDPSLEQFLGGIKECKTISLGDKDFPWYRIYINGNCWWDSMDKTINYATPTEVISKVIDDKVDLMAIAQTSAAA